MLIRFGLVLAAAVLLGRLGPFGTFSELQPVARYSYWVGLTLLMWLQGLAALALISATIARQGYSTRIVIAAILAAIPTAFEVAWAEMLLRVERDLGAVDLLGIFGDVSLLSVPLLLATQLLVRREPTRTTAPESSSAKGVDWLLAQLPPKRRGRLLAINSEDHYIRVHTAAGTELLHMRFSDAVARLAGAGVQVHRSWWIAKGAAASHVREGDRVILELPDGTRVPVSRSYVLAARQAGVIAGV